MITDIMLTHDKRTVADGRGILARGTIPMPMRFDRDPSPQDPMTPYTS